MLEGMGFADTTIDAQLCQAHEGPPDGSDVRADIVRRVVLVCGVHAMAARQV